VIELFSVLHSKNPLVSTSRIVSSASTATRAVVRPPVAVRPTIQEVFLEHVAFVWRVVAAHGIPESDVQDVTQEVFLAAHRRNEDWDPDRCSARTWLYAIAIRTAANHRRLAHRHRERASDDLDAERDAGARDPGELIDRERCRARLYQVLSELDPGQRDVFILFELQGMPMKAVAETVGCTEKTAYWRLAAARREVAARFDANELRSGEP
jgi:RNA polymerase sigma-70 factor (ECF subfamily)